MSEYGTVPERVAKGVELLDKYGPDDWREKIDLYKFSIRDGEKCVLGQVYESYARGTSVLEIESELSYVGGYQFGFDSNSADAVAVEAEWRRVVRNVPAPVAEPTFTLSELKILSAGQANDSGRGVALRALLDSRDPAKQKVTVELTRGQIGELLTHGLDNAEIIQALQKARA